MREITLQELAALAENAKGEIRRIHLHWTAGHYNNTYDDYHLNITGDGTVWSSCGKLTEYKEHTWHRNSGAVAVSICCCADAVAYADGGVDFGSVPPTRQQLETLARVVAVLCRGLDLPIDDNYVMTHAEAADLDDYGPATTFERWDLWKLASADGTLQDGGALIRSKAKACCQW